MPNRERDARAVNLGEERERLFAAARTSHAHRAANAVYGSRDTAMRQTMLALLAGGDLAEHDSPPEATLQMLVGRVRLSAGERSWELTEGDLVAIPPERHSVTAVEDSVFLLTVIRTRAAAPGTSPA